VSGFGVKGAGMRFGLWSVGSMVQGLGFSI